MLTLVVAPWRQAGAARVSSATMTHPANIAEQAKDVLGADKLQAVAGRSYFDGEQILACDRAAVWVMLPRPQR